MKAAGRLKAEVKKQRGNTGLLARARRQNCELPHSLLGRRLFASLSVSVDAVCIGCGCTDSHACVDQIFGEACFWIKVDRGLRIGVCSSCEHKIEEYEDRVNQAKGMEQRAKV